jgi:hypothetical protein
VVLADYDDASPRDIPLDLIGIRRATDKSSLIGDYLRHYERIFKDIRNEAFTLLEIGVFRGGSVQTWEEFFAKARIVGVDIDPSCRSYASERVTIEIGSQNDARFLHQLTTKYQPTVIIDDGSHLASDVIFTFERLFPTLPSGGIYVIEDLHFHILESDSERLRGGSPIPASDYVLELLRDKLGGENHLRTLKAIRRHMIAAIDRIEIIAATAIIYRRDPTRSLDELRALRPDVDASQDWRNWLVFSSKLLEAGEDKRVVVEGLRRAIALNPQAIVVYDRLSSVLETLGDHQGAVAILEQAVANNRTEAGSADRGRRIERLRQFAAAGQAQPAAGTSAAAGAPRP